MCKAGSFLRPYLFRSKGKAIPRCWPRDYWTRNPCQYQRDTWDDIRLGKHKHVSQYSFTSFKVGNAFMEDASYSNLPVIPRSHLTSEHCPLLIFFIVILPWGCSLETLTAKLPFLSHGVTCVSQICPIPISPFQQGMENLPCYGICQSSRYLNPSCCWYFSDWGEAGNIGNRHPSGVCKTQPLIGIVVNLSQMTIGLKTDSLLLWSARFKIDVCLPHDYPRMHFSI